MSENLLPSTPSATVPLPVMSATPSASIPGSVMPAGGTTTTPGAVLSNSVTEAEDPLPILANSIHTIPQVVLVFGDSMSSDAQSAQYPPSTAGLSWPSRMAALLPNTTIVNFGTSSRTAETMISLYPSLVAGYVAQAAASWIFVQAGYNDHNEGATAATVASRLQTLVGLGKADNFNVAIFTVHAPDQETYFNASKPRCERLRDINRAILLNAAAWGADAIYRYDLAFDQISDRDSEGRPFNQARWFVDGLHPVSETSQRMGEQLAKLVRKKPTGIITYPQAPLESQLNRDTEFDSAWRAGNRYVPTLSGNNDLVYFFDRYVASHTVTNLASGSKHPSEVNSRTFGRATVTTSNNTTLCKLARVASTGVQVFKAGNDGGGVTGFVMPAIAATPWVWSFIGFGYGGGKTFGAAAFSPALSYTSGRHCFNHAEGTVNITPVIPSNQMVAIAVRLDGSNSKVYYYDGTTFVSTAFSTTSTTPTALQLGVENAGDAGKMHHAGFLSCASASISDAQLESWMRNLNHYGVGTITST